MKPPLKEQLLLPDELASSEGNSTKAAASPVRKVQNVFKKGKPKVRAPVPSKISRATKVLDISVPDNNTSLPEESSVGGKKFNCKNQRRTVYSTEQRERFGRYANEFGVPATKRRFRKELGNLHVCDNLQF